MKVLAVLTLLAWFVVLVSLAGGKGNTKGAHVAIAPVLSLALALCVVID